MKLDSSSIGNVAIATTYFTYYIYKCILCMWLIAHSCHFPKSNERPKRTNITLGEKWRLKIVNCIYIRHRQASSKWKWAAQINQTELERREHIHMVIRAPQSILSKGKSNQSPPPSLLPSSSPLLSIAFMPQPSRVYSLCCIDRTNNKML